MVNEKLIEWIKSEEAQGYTPEQLHSYLVDKGYSKEEASAAIKSVNPDIPTEDELIERRKPIRMKPSRQISKKTILEIIAVFVGVIVIGLTILAVMYYSDQGVGYDDNDTTPDNENETTITDDLPQDGDETLPEDDVGPDDEPDTIDLDTVYIDITFPKSDYMIGEPFDQASMDITYHGLKFKALIYTAHKKGQSAMHTSHIFEFKDIETKNEINVPGLDTRLYAFDSKLYPLNFFHTEGTYTYEISVYDCRSVEAAIKANCILFNYSHIGLVAPLTTAAKSITVKGKYTGSGSPGCINHDDCTDSCSGCAREDMFCDFSSSTCSECKSNSDCQLGYHCFEPTRDCLSNTLYKGFKSCTSQSECQSDTCERCAAGTKICRGLITTLEPGEDIYDYLRCIECQRNIDCAQGYTCVDYKCVA